MTETTVKMQHTYGIFDNEADEIVSLVCRHASLNDVRSTGCPACGSPMAVEFVQDGTGFYVYCDGTPLHMSTVQEISNPPPWWRECVSPATDSTFYWQAKHRFDADGNLSMLVSGWTAEGVRWSGSMSCPVNHPDHAFWRWAVLESGCAPPLINDAELSRLREKFAKRSDDDA